MAKLRNKLVEKLQKIPGVIEREWPNRSDGFTSLNFSGKAFAHFHHDNEIDIRLTKKLIIEQSLSSPDDSVVHPNRSRNSSWIELRSGTEKDVDKIVDLVTRLLIKQNEKDDLSKSQ